MQPRKGRAPIREAKEFEEEVIQIDRVTRVVKGGRRLRFRATVVVGNRKGKVGVGIGKSTEVQGAIQKAISQAKKSLIEVPIIGQTIPHRVQVKFKSAKLLLMPACPGTGIIAGGPLRKIIELSGIRDVMGKSFGSNNRLSNSQAAIMALSELRTLPWIAKKIAAAKAPITTQPAAAQPAAATQPAKAAQPVKTETNAPQAKPQHPNTEKPGAPAVKETIKSAKAPTANPVKKKE
jgi:small subunit ribosomal protein S5